MQFHLMILDETEEGERESPSMPDWLLSCNCAMKRIPPYIALPSSSSHPTHFDWILFILLRDTMCCNAIYQLSLSLSLPLLPENVLQRNTQRVGREIKNKWVVWEFAPLLYGLWGEERVRIREHGTREEWDKDKLIQGNTAWKGNKENSTGVMMINWVSEFFWCLFLTKGEHTKVLQRKCEWEFLPLMLSFYTTLVLFCTGPCWDDLPSVIVIHRHMNEAANIPRIWFASFPLLFLRFSPMSHEGHASSLPYPCVDLDERHMERW
jgi:hypothetical protein